MIAVVKSDEPVSVKIWKSLACSNWQPAWSNLQNPEKLELLSQLIQDQRGICCYCEAGITIDNSHIEHIIPRSADKDKHLSYGNLLASCLKETAKGMPLTCGKARGNWHDDAAYLNPCDPRSAEKIKYSMDGKVSATPDTHNEFVLRLNLNSSTKVSSRKAAAAIFDIDDSIDDAKIILQGLLDNRELPEYISYLKATAEAYFGIR